MKIKIDFFNENIIDAIGAGIYQVSIMNNGKEEVLYIGESVFVLVRCGAHLFELKKTPEYFGFNDETINNENICCSFLCHLSFSFQKSRKCLYFFFY